MARSQILGTLAVVVLVSTSTVAWVFSANDSDAQGWRMGVAGLTLAIFSIALGVWFFWLSDVVSVRRDLRLAEDGARAVAQDLPTEVPVELLASTRPSDLLLPEQRLMPIRGRGRHLDELRAWCGETQAPRFFLVTGPALAGKTRLMVELAHRRIGPERRISRLRPGHEKEAFAALSQVSGPHLVVVEVTAAGNDLGAFLSDVSAAREDFRWRVALVCRDPAAIPRSRDETARRVVEDAARFSTGLEADFSSEDLRRWRSEAAIAFSRRLGSEAPRSSGQIDAPTNAPIGLVVARGLADALGDSRGSESVWPSLVHRELLTWPPLTSVNGDHCAPGKSPGRWCFALAWLLGLSTRAEILGLMTEVLDEDEAALREVASLLMGLYPDGAGGFSPPSGPITTWIALPELLAREEAAMDIVADRGPVLRANALAKLIAATSEVPQAAGLANQVLDRSGAQLEASVLVRLGALSSFDQQLDHVLVGILRAHPPLSTADGEALVQEIKELGLTLAESVAYEVYVELLRAEARDTPERYPELADSLYQYAYVLYDLGQLEPALTAVEESLALCRNLAGDNPDSRLAKTLRGNSAVLDALGRHGHALAAARESLTLFRDLSRNQPDPDVASTLTNYARHLSNVGQYEPALKAAEESVDLFRQLAREHPDRYNAKLANAVVHYSQRLTDEGQHEPALKAVEEGVALCKELVRKHPDRYNPSLAWTLANYATVLKETGPNEPARAVAEQSVALYRKVTRRYPDVYNPELADSLNTYSVVLSNLGRHELALAALDEGLSLTRKLVSQHPDSYNPRLVMLLRNYVGVLADLERYESALAPAVEGVDLCRVLVRENRHRHNSDLSAALINYANVLATVGPSEAALDAAEEGLGMLRESARETPHRHGLSLVRALGNYAMMLYDLRRFEPALAATDEALAIPGPSSLAFRQAIAQVRRLALAILETTEKREEAARVAAGLPRVPPSSRPSR